MHSASPCRYTQGPGQRLGRSTLSDGAARRARLALQGRRAGRARRAVRALLGVGLGDERRRDALHRGQGVLRVRRAGVLRHAPPSCGLAHYQTSICSTYSHVLAWDTPNARLPIRPQSPSVDFSREWLGESAWVEAMLARCDKFWTEMQAEVHELSFSGTALL